MNDRLAKPAAAEDDNGTELLPTVFFAVPPDAFMDGVAVGISPSSWRRSPSDDEDDDRSPLASWDRWSF